MMGKKINLGKRVGKGRIKRKEVEIGKEKKSDLIISKGRSYSIRICYNLKENAPIDSLSYLPGANLISTQNNSFLGPQLNS